MSKIMSNPKLPRRNFLKLLAAVGVTGVGGHILSSYEPWISYDQMTRDTWQYFSKDTTPSIQMRELVRYATLAANGHNAQPWKFAIRENEIEIHPDLKRQLPVVDPENRELWISLGCALENLLIAARVIGYTALVTYPDHANFIQVSLSANKALENPLFSVIPLRQNTRTEYNGRLIKRADFDQVKALPLEQGVSLFFMLNPTLMDAVLEYVNNGNKSQYADEAYIEELITWLRFNKKEAYSSCDGLYSRCSGNPEVPRWLGEMFVTGTTPEQQAESDARILRSSPTVVVIASDADNRTAWVRTGQVYERLALTMTKLGIQSAFLNQPFEVPDLRSQFQSTLGMGAFLPQLLVRFGYADPVAKNSISRSLRRPVDQVII